MRNLFLRNLLLFVGALVLSGCSATLLGTLSSIHFYLLLTVLMTTAGCLFLPPNSLHIKGKLKLKTDPANTTINIPALYIGTNLSDTDDTHDYITDVSTSTDVTGIYDPTGTIVNSVLFENHSGIANYASPFISGNHASIQANRANPASPSREFFVFRDLQTSDGITTKEIIVDTQGGDDIVYSDGNIVVNNAANVDFKLYMGEGDDIFIPSGLVINSVDLGPGNDKLVLQRIANTSEFNLVKGEDKIVLANGLTYAELTFENDGTGARILAPIVIGSSTTIVIGKVPYQYGFTNLADVQNQSNFLENYIIK